MMQSRILYKVFWKLSEWADDLSLWLSGIAGKFLPNVRYPSKVYIKQYIMPLEDVKGRHADVVYYDDPYTELNNE